MSGNQDQPCETVKSTRGGDKVVVTGFLFTLGKTRDNIVHYWHCDQKRKFKCKVTAQTELIDGEHFLAGTSGEHTHEALHHVFLCSINYTDYQITGISGYCCNSPHE
jgi:hypothetical protein